MDSLTHIVLGACMGELIAGKKIGKKAMLIGAVANNIPDIDVITSFWMTMADGLLAHRGFTHSILFALLASPLLAALCKKVCRRIDLSFFNWLMLIGSGMFVHIFIDAFTTYGTGWFEPFSHYRVTFNTLFILDPVILLVLLTAALALLIIKRNSESRNAWARTGIIICSLYLTITVAIKFFVNATVSKNMASQNISSKKYMTSPAPLNNILWYIIIKSDNGYYTGYYSLFDNCPITFDYVEGKDSLQTRLADGKDLQKLKRFSDGYYCFTNNYDTVVFNDMRFGQVQGWSRQDAAFVFKFNLNTTADNDLVIQRGRMENVSEEAFTSLWERIKGNCPEK